MHRRRITLPDGRSMIFYTFGDPDPLTDDRAADRPQDGDKQPAGGPHV